MNRVLIDSGGKRLPAAALLCTLRNGNHGVFHRRKSRTSQIVEVNFKPAPDDLVTTFAHRFLQKCNP